MVSVSYLIGRGISRSLGAIATGLSESSGQVAAASGSFSGRWRVEEAVRRRILFEHFRDGIVVLDQNCKLYDSMFKVSSFWFRVSKHLIRSSLTFCGAYQPFVLRYRSRNRSADKSSHRQSSSPFDTSGRTGMGTSTQMSKNFCSGA